MTASLFVTESRKVMRSWPYASMPARRIKTIRLCKYTCANMCKRPKRVMGTLAAWGSAPNNAVVGGARLLWHSNPKELQPKHPIKIHSRILYNHLPALRNPQPRHRSPSAGFNCKDTSRMKSIVRYTKASTTNNAIPTAEASLPDNRKTHHFSSTLLTNSIQPSKPHNLSTLTPSPETQKFPSISKPCLNKKWRKQDPWT